MKKLFSNCSFINIQAAVWLSVGSIMVSKQKLHSTTSFLVYNNSYSKERLTPFSSGVFPGKPVLTRYAINNNNNDMSF